MAYRPSSLHLTAVSLISERVVSEMSTWPAPCCGHDPGRPVDVDARVVIADQRRGPGVDAHPNLHLRPTRPLCAVESLLGLDGAPDGFAGLGEGREQAIAFAAEYRTAVPIYRSLGDLAVCGEELRIVGPDPFEQTGGSFDVQEQKRDRSAGECHVSRRGDR